VGGVMARPTKEGLDYFPLDIDFDQDDKLVVPINKFGMQGLGIIIKLMTEIYRNGYFYPWGEREQYVFANKVHVDINATNDVVNECLKWGFFSKDVFEKYNLLTSRGIQKRYVEASRRRKIVVFVREYTLINLYEACKKCSPINEVDVNGNEVNVYINPDKVNGELTISTQSKKKVNRKGNREESNKKISVDPPAAESHDNGFHADFERFWDVFPKIRRRDKAKAFETWKKKVKDIEREDLIRCTELYAKDTNAIGKDGAFAKMPTSFLNAGTYKDYLQGGMGNEKDEQRHSSGHAGGTQTKSEYAHLDDNEPFTGEFELDPSIL
jgi:hypothetical protein